MYIVSIIMMGLPSGRGSVFLFWCARKEASPTHEGPLLKLGENYSSFGQDCSKCSPSAKKTPQRQSAVRGRGGVPAPVGSQREVRK